MDMFNFLALIIGFIASIITIYAFFKAEKLPASIAPINSSPEYDSSYELLKLQNPSDDVEDEVSKEILRRVNEFDANEFHRLQYMYNPEGFYELVMDAYNHMRIASLFFMLICIIFFISAVILSIFSHELTPPPSCDVYFSFLILYVFFISSKQRTR